MLSTSHSPGSKRKLPRARIFATVALLAATTWWLGNLARLEASVSEVATILGTAALVAAACLLVHGVVHLLARRVRLGPPLVFSHFLQGSLVFCAYMAALMVEPAVFLDSWRSLYFGYYAYDIAVILIFWRRLFRAFRFFYTVHHVFSLTITGVWMAFGGPWLDYIILGVAIWLSSDLWTYGLAMYRSTWGRGRPRAQIARLRLGVFWLERCHRLMAYVVPWIIADFTLSSFALLVFGTGLANDLLDAGFQWRGIQKTRARSQPTASTRRGSDRRPESRGSSSPIAPTT